MYTYIINLKRAPQITHARKMPRKLSSIRSGINSPIPFRWHLIDARAGHTRLFKLTLREKKKRTLHYVLQTCWRIAARKKRNICET